MNIKSTDNEMFYGIIVFSMYLTLSKTDLQHATFAPTF